MGETAEMREARELGKNYGDAQGSWVTDGNSSDETRRWVIQAIDDGDPAFEVPAPLSGEWADGYTLGRLSDELGVDEGSDGFPDLCTAFEDAYYEAFVDRAYADAKGSLSETEV